VAIATANNTLKMKVVMMSLPASLALRVAMYAKMEFASSALRDILCPQQEPACPVTIYAHLAAVDQIAKLVQKDHTSIQRLARVKPAQLRTATIAKAPLHVIVVYLDFI